MVQYGNLSKEDTVLEVGAGRGELTWRLAEAAGRVIAVEVDRRLAEEAWKRLKRYRNVKLLVGDVLKLRPTGFNKVVSNPPYNISTKLLEWIIRCMPKKMVLTLQKEFASKLVARPGSAKYLYISFLSSLFYSSRIVELVPRGAFRPIPKVDSAIVVMELKPHSPRIDERRLKSIKLMFTRRRQSLRRVLRSLIGDRVEIFPNDLLSKRIYQLTPTQLISITEELDEMKLKR